MINVETKLKRMRKKRGLSQSQLAKASGVSLKIIQFHEQRLRNIDAAKLGTLCSLCIALNCRLEDIIESKELIERYRKIK